MKGRSSTPGFRSRKARGSDVGRAAGAAVASEEGQHGEISGRCWGVDWLCWSRMIRDHSALDPQWSDGPANAAQRIPRPGPGPAAKRTTPYGAGSAPES